MAQLRADIHQTENEKKRKCEIENLHVLPTIDSDNQDIINIESQDDVRRMLENLRDATSDYITTEQDWNERLEEWNELLIEEQRSQSLVATEESNPGTLDHNELLSLYTHPAIDLDAKWDLRDLFIRELERPEFISISSEFN